MAKANEAFRTISEVSDGLGVPKHVLRFWEAKFPQIKPMKRGGGRRFYRPEDLELLRGIRHLLHQAGYTIKGVQKILREQGADAVKVFGTELASAGKKQAPPLGKSAAAPADGKPARGRPRAGPTGDDRQRLIKSMMAELEACLVLLGRPASSTADRAATTRRVS